MIRLPEIDINDYEVLSNAKRADNGELVVDGIVSNVLFNPNINGTIVLGQGASGKSMLLGQTVRLLKQKKDIDQLNAIVLGHTKLEAAKSTWVIPQIYPFDAAVTKVVNDLGGLHQMYWQPNKWDLVSDKIFNDINPALDFLKKQGQTKSVRREEPIWHIFNDSVVVGDLNKGTTAIERLLKRHDVMVYGMISDPKNQARAIHLRRVSENLPPEAIQTLFKNEGINLDIDDFGRVPFLMSRMANEKLIEENNQQIEVKIDGILSSGLVKLQDNLLLDSIKDQIRANYKTSEIGWVLNYYQRRLIHMNYLLRYQLNAPEELAVSVVNVHIKDKPIHWYQKDLESSTP